MKYFSFLIKLRDEHAECKSLSCLLSLEKEKKGVKILQMMEIFYFLIRTKYQQTSLKCSENFTCNYSKITSPVENSQPSNLHFRVEEIFTLKSITLYVWHILEHRKSIYLREMRNSGMILAKKLLKFPHFITFYLPVLHLPILNPTFQVVKFNHM